MHFSQRTSGFADCTAASTSSVGGQLKTIRVIDSQGGEPTFAASYANGSYAQEVTFVKSPA